VKTTIAKPHYAARPLKGTLPLGYQLMWRAIRAIKTDIETSRVATMAGVSRISAVQYIRNLAKSGYLEHTNTTSGRAVPKLYRLVHDNGPGAPKWRKS
jgi:response regulator of citrate/malate metabolism